MAQPTVTARPANWAGTSGPILYKLTSTNYTEVGYRLEVEIWDNVAAAKIADAVYSADPSGFVTVDISSFLSANMSLVNNSDLTAVFLYEDNNWINYYIKYQEVWIDGSETQVNDSANDRFAIYGGLQIGSTNNLSAYTSGTFLFLTLQGELTGVRGLPFTISFYADDAGDGMALRMIKYLNGSTVSTSDLPVSSLAIWRGCYEWNNDDADVVEFVIIDAVSFDPVSEVKTLRLREACDNSIMLQWKNSLGGDECFPFQINQEYTWNYSGKKAKRLTLYADNLTLNQWEAIQGLNTLGETYRVNITEMTTGLNRTSDKVGQSVNILNADGSKTGVVVINQPNTTQTKQVKHSAVVTIEYPELLLQ